MVKIVKYSFDEWDLARRNNHIKHTFFIQEIFKGNIKNAFFNLANGLVRVITLFNYTLIREGNLGEKCSKCDKYGLVGNYKLCLSCRLKKLQEASLDG